MPDAPPTVMRVASVAGRVGTVIGSPASARCVPRGTPPRVKLVPASRGSDPAVGPGAPQKAAARRAVTRQRRVRILPLTIRPGQVVRGTNGILAPTGSGPRRQLACHRGNSASPERPDHEAKRPSLQGAPRGSRREAAGRHDLQPGGTRRTTADG